MSDQDNPSKVTLESLLKVKRSERPGDEFWESFDVGFQRRRLNALMEKPSLYNRWARPLIRLAAVAIPACVAMGTFVWFQAPLQNTVVEEVSSNRSLADKNPQTAGLNTASAAVSDKQASFSTPPMAAAGIPRFITDSLSNRNRESLHFRKVLYSPSLHSNTQSSAVYVADPLSEKQGYKISAASYNPGRNF